MDESVDKEAVAAPEPAPLPGKAQARAERPQPVSLDADGAAREASSPGFERPDAADSAYDHKIEEPGEIPTAAQDRPEHADAAQFAAGHAERSVAPEPVAAADDAPSPATPAPEPGAPEASAPVVSTAVSEDTPPPPTAGLAPPFVPPSARIPVIEPSAPIGPGARPGLPTDAESGAITTGTDVSSNFAASSVFQRAPGALRRIPEAVTAQIIPFVPRNGLARSEAPAEIAPPPVPADPPFARQPLPYFVSPAEGLAPRPPQPAMPPPPSGFRRPADWSRQPAEPAVDAPASAEPLAAEMPPRAKSLTPLTWPSWLPRQFAPLNRSTLASAVAWSPGRSWREGWSVRRVLKGALQAVAVLLAAYATLIAVLVVAYRWIDPPMSALMLGQRLAGTEVSQRWVSLDKISPNLQQAVVLSEDGRFCQHRGVDWGELKEAIEQSLDGWGARGGSTISMQTAKNLFLWPSKSYVRKGIEIPLAMGTEMVWPKARMLEIYLNIAEWGPGIFGAEAAARYHFGKPASALTPREASLLAVSLPNPFDRQAGRPGPGTQRLADNLQVRMRRVPNAASCGRTQRARGAPGVADSRWP